MRDKDLRESVWRWLEVAHQGDQDTLMLDELGILNGATRIDIAVINGRIEGYELKSERDTLERLQRRSLRDAREAARNESRTGRCPIGVPSVAG